MHCPVVNKCYTPSIVFLILNFDTSKENSLYRMTIEVGYWNLRGLVGFIRLIDAYTEEGIKWTTYEVAKYEEWKEEKAKNENNFGMYYKTTYHRCRQEFKIN